MTRFLALDAGWIWLVDPESDRFYLAASFRLPPYLQQPMEMTGDPCWCLQAFRDGDFVSENVDVIQCSRLRKGLREGGPEIVGGLRSHASVALRFGERQLGLLNVSGAQSEALDAESLRLLAVVGAQLGIAIERARLAETAANAARADERARLARDIHDTLAQDLTAIALQLEGAVRHVADEDREAKARIATALAVTREALAHARDSVLGLRSDPLGGKPLESALAALARRFASETGIRTSFRAEGNGHVPRDVETELYRIESVLAFHDGAIVLRVIDDGTGFDRQQHPADRYGILGMEERARAIGGTLRVASAAGGGTTIEAIVPVPPR